jgi:hypothetical protein
MLSKPPLGKCSRNIRSSNGWNEHDNISKEGHDSETKQVIGDYVLPPRQYDGWEDMTLLTEPFGAEDLQRVGDAEYVDISGS